MYRSLLVRIKKDKDEKERKEKDQKDKEEKEKEEKLKKEKEKERKKLGSKKSFFGFPNAQPFGKRPQPSLAPEPTTPTTPTAPKDGAEMVKSFALSKPLPPVIKVSISTALKVSESSPSIEPTPPASKPGPVPPASFKLAPSVPPPASRPALSPQKLPTQQLPAQQPRPHQFAHQQSDPRQIPFQQAPPRQHLPPGDGCGQHHGPTPFDLSQSPCFNVPPPGFPQTSIGGQTSIFARPPPTLSSQSPAPPPAPITSQTPGPVIKSLLSLNVPPPEDDHLTAPGESRKRRWEADPGPPCDFSVPPPIKRLEVSPRPESNGGGDTNDSLSRLKSLVEKAVIPLCRSTIEQQHHIKEQTVLTLLTSLREKVVETNLAADAFLQHQESRIGYFLHLDRIVPSPLLDGYRNKCDFAVGVNPVSKKLAVGFRLRPDVPEVGPVDHLRHIPDRIKRVVVKTELLFRDLKMPPFDVKQGTGFWSSVTVRLSKLEQLMLIFTLNPQELNDLELNHIKERIKAFAERQLGTPDKIDSMYLNIKETGHDSGIYEHICGEKLIKEQVLNRVLQISPQSFFPSNTSAAELTYDIIAESAGLHMDSTLVDVCCGVGSIAISLSNRCGQILGLDIATAAVEDARMNALVNDITNGEFHPGSAEEYLGVLWRRAIFGELVRFTYSRSNSRYLLMSLYFISDLRCRPPPHWTSSKGHQPPPQGGKDQEGTLPLLRRSVLPGHAGLPLPRAV
jgi:tRNA/tmRNA/rRNA uracil-C5-methylase (TrmA/RlmC/RlmD family)